MGITPLTFTGTSQYSSDFQSILSRAVAISEIPLQQLENTDRTILSKESQLGGFQSAISNLASAVQSLGTLASNQALSANSSNPSAVSVTATGAANPASYTINSVTSLAAAASETSTTGYTDSNTTTVSSSGSLNLVVGGKQYGITLTSQTNNLVGLVGAINAQNAGVTASILTTGNGNYLSVSSNTLGATTLQLFDDPTGANQNLLTSANQGTNAVFMLNNLPVTRTDNTVNDLIPGATLTLQAPTNTPLTLSLASDPNQLASGIQSLVSAYNAAVDQVNGQTGTSGGVLSGDSVVWQLEGDLRQVTTFQGSGSVKSLADMGIQLGSDGKMTFNQSVFNSLSNSQLAGALQFFGSSTTGFGGLSQTLAQLSDPISGSIATEQLALQQSDLNLQSQIATSTANINAMQNTLFQQLSQADTLISTLNSQQSALTASISSLNYVTYGKNSTTSIA